MRHIFSASPVETAAQRYDRDYLRIPDLDTEGNGDYRHDRTILQQSTERKERLYAGAVVDEPSTPQPGSYSDAYSDTY